MLSTIPGTPKNTPDDIVTIFIGRLIPTENTDSNNATAIEITALKI